MVEQAADGNQQEVDLVAQQTLDGHHPFADDLGMGRDPVEGIRVQRRHAHGPPGVAAGQSQATIDSAVNSITPHDILGRIAVIAADSMRGRSTPSLGLELTAAYIAGQFRRVGLAPAGDGSGYVQRFSLLRVEARYLLVKGSDGSTWRAGRHLVQLSGGTVEAVSGSAFVVGGRAVLPADTEPAVRGRGVERLADRVQLDFPGQEHLGEVGEGARGGSRLPDREEGEVSSLGYVCEYDAPATGREHRTSRTTPSSRSIRAPNVRLPPHRGHATCATDPTSISRIRRLSSRE